MNKLNTNMIFTAKKIIIINNNDNNDSNKKKTNKQNKRILWMIIAKKNEKPYHITVAEFLMRACSNLQIILSTSSYPHPV